jgi:hypothetical protein
VRLRRHLRRVQAAAGAPRVPRRQKVLTHTQQKDATPEVA